MAYTPLAEAESFDPEKEKELYASLYPTAGVAVNPETGNAINPEQQGLLEQSREAEEAEAEQQQARSAGGMSPGLASVLGAAGSLLRTSGWQSQPLSYAQRLGYAIPAGMQAYYQQGAYNQEAEEAYNKAETERAKAESASEDREAFRQALTSSGLDPGWFPIFMGVYNTDAKDGWDKLRAKVEKNRKGKDTKYVSKEKLIELNDPDADQVPEGGYMMEDKEGKRTIVDKNYNPITKDKDSTWGLPYTLGDNWVQNEFAADGTETGKIQVIGSRSKKTEKGTEIRAMLGSDLEAQGKKVANPDMYYEVTGRDEDGDGKYIGNEILTWKQLEDAKTVFNAEADLLGTWGMTSDEAQKILKNRGIQLPTDVTTREDFDKFRVEAKTDKDGNYTVKVLTPLGATLFEDFKEGEVAKRHAATLEQRQNHYNADEHYRWTKFDAFIEQQKKDNGWKKGEIDRAIEIHELRKKQMEKNLKKGYEYFTAERFLQTDIGKKLGKLDPNIASVEKGPDGQLRFLDGTGMPYKEAHKIIKVYNDKTDRTHNHLIDKNGIFLKDLGPTERQYEATVDRLKYNRDLQLEDDRKQTFEELVRRLGENYGYDNKILTNLRLRGVADIGSALKEVNEIYDREREKDRSLVHGLELIKRFGDDAGFDKTKTYQYDGTKYVAFSPDEKTYTGTRQLMNDWESLTRDQQVAARGYNGIINGLRQGNGAGDIMAITTFRIMFEPNSVVRETEFAITQRAQGVFNQAKTLLEKFKEGDKLSPEGRKTMFKLATEYMQGAAEWVQSRYVQYSNIANKFGFDPELTVVHPFDPWKDSWAGRFITNRTNPDVKADYKSLSDEKFPDAKDKNAPKKGVRVNPRTGTVIKTKRTDEENDGLDAQNATLNLTPAPG